jgi:hypothetical protein
LQASEPPPGTEIGPMTKLKLEDLEITSFETSAAAVQRGTVIANAPPQGTLYIPTYEPDACGETYEADVCGTKDLYCTYGCSVNITCARTCILTG